MTQKITSLKLTLLWFVSTLAILVLGLAQVLRFPSPLQDAVTGDFLTEFSLEFPLLYLWTTPFSAYADLITYNSARQDIALVLYLILGYWALPLIQPGRLKTVLGWILGYFVYLALVLAFLVWAILSPRPAARLHVSDPNLVVLDFHSHTHHSWDGRRSYSPEANVQWHKDMGFTAGFITDHNTALGAQQAKERSRREYPQNPYRALMGEELSLHKTHIVLLGNNQTIDNTPYNGDLAGVERFLKQCKKGKPCMLSLPEYWLHHWDRLEKVAGWGASGIEIVNASPKALDFPKDKKRQVIELCRKRNFFMAGISDNHGWGRASYVWNIMRIPGQAAMGPDQLEKVVLETLSLKGFQAVQIVTRVKQRPWEGAWIVLDPLLGIWTLLRTFSNAQAGITLIWIWFLALLVHLAPRQFAKLHKPSSL